MNKSSSAASHRKKAANKNEGRSLMGYSLSFKENKSLKIKEPVSCYGVTPDMVSGVLSDEESEEYRIVCGLHYT